MVKRSF